LAVIPFIQLALRQRSARDSDLPIVAKMLKLSNLLPVFADDGRVAIAHILEGVSCGVMADGGTVPTHLAIGCVFADDSNGISSMIMVCLDEDEEDKLSIWAEVTEEGRQRFREMGLHPRAFCGDWMRCAYYNASEMEEMSK